MQNFSIFVNCRAGKSDGHLKKAADICSLAYKLIFINICNMHKCGIGY